MNARSAWIQHNPDRSAEIARALTVAGEGSVLLQTFINRVVQMLTIRVLGFQAILDRREGSGNAEYINRRTPGTTGGEWVNDTEASQEETGDYAQASFLFRTLLTKGKVTRKLQATGRSYGDALAKELNAKVDDFRDALEVGLVTGDNNANAKQINGLLTLVNAVSGQVIANTSNTSGADIIAEKLDETIDQVKDAEDSSNVYLVVSKLGSRKLNGILSAQQQFNDVVEIAAGFRVRTYDGHPIVKTTKMPNTLACDASGNIATFTGGSTTCIAVVNTTYVYISELTALSVLPLAKTTSQYDEFEMYWDGALVLDNTFGAALLTNIKT